MYLLLTNGTPFTYVVKTLHPFYVLKITEPGGFLVLFTTHLTSVSHFKSFDRPK